MSENPFNFNNNNLNNFYNSDENSNDSEEENSGVLAYDEVRDIIIYYDMGEIDKKDKYLFFKNDYDKFIKKKEKIFDFFFNNNNKIKNNNIKTPTTNESSKGKKNFINVIKENFNL
jgi:hypothetical protein